MHDEQLLRYSRQILLPQVGIQGQQRLLQARVLIIGIGGLGSPVAMYLAASGIGHLVLADSDRVELSNLQRQIAYASDDIGRAKVAAARDSLRRLNPDIRVTALEARLGSGSLLEHCALADVVVDASDNFATRFAINAACIEAATPLVSGAAIRTEGQVSVFLNDRSEQPCYRCLYPQEGPEETTCSENGVLAPVVGIIGSVQATEAIKLLVGFGKTLAGRVLVLDASTMEWRSFRLRKDPSCASCSNHPNDRQQKSG